MPSIPCDSVQPWQRQPGESARAYAAFVLYRDAGAARSIDAAYRAHRAATGQQQSSKRAPRRWMEWARQHGWVERVAAYDRYLLEVEQAAREEALKAEAAKWARRRERQREAEWRASQQLIQRAKKMLDHPVTELKVDDEGEATILPAKWQARDIPAFFETASRLARLSAEMETDRGAHTVSAKLEVDEKPKAGATEEERAREVAALVHLAELRRMQAESANADSDPHP